MRQDLNASKTVYYNDFVMVRVDKTDRDLLNENLRADLIHNIGK